MNPIKCYILITLLSITLSVNAQYYLKTGYIEIVEAQTGKPGYTYKNLTLYPLIAGDKFMKETQPANKYLTLEQALNTQKIIITEADGGEVNRLYIENVSKDTVFIMAGEVVKGGKQDRVMGKDMILLPKSGKIDMEVFCVEHNRWTYKSDRNFSSYHSVSSNSVRKKAAVDKDQSGVWSEVAKVTESQGAKTSTGTYTAISQSDNFQKEISAYEAYFANTFAGIKNCIGFVGVSGDKIIGCDIFANPDMFSKQMKNLIGAYSTEAINNGTFDKLRYPTPEESKEKVVEYLNDFLSENVNQDSKIKEKGTQLEYQGKKVHINTY